MVESEHVAVLTIPTGDRAPSEARAFVRGTLESWGLDGAVDPAVLLVSELVSNSVLHTGTRARLSVLHEGVRIRVEVEDLGPGGAARRTAAPRDPSGRGLLIVERMADRWGTSGSAGHNVVWFELEVALQA